MRQLKVFRRFLFLFRFHRMHGEGILLAARRALKRGRVRLGTPAYWNKLGAEGET